MLDLVLRGGTVVDGTGAAAAGPTSASATAGWWPSGPVDEGGRRTLDVDGHGGLPGFIDIHTHYDAQLLWDPTASPSVLHGVTTVLGGNCGFSIAPLGPGDAAYIQRMMAVVEGIPLGRAGGRGHLGVDLVRPVPRPDRRGPGRQRRLPGRTLDRPPGGDGRGGHRGGPPPSSSLPWSAWSGSRWPGARSGFSSSLGEGHLDGTGRPVPSRAASAERVVALAGAVRDHPGTTLEFIPTVGPDPRGPDGAHGRHVPGRRPAPQLEPPRQPGLRGDLRAAAAGVRLAAANGRPRGGPGPARHDADAGQQPLAGLPGWGDVLDLDRGGRLAAAADPGPRAALRAGAERWRTEPWACSPISAHGGGRPGVGVGRPVAGRDRRPAGHRRHRRPHRRGPASTGSPSSSSCPRSRRPWVGPTRDGRPGWRCGRTRGSCSGARTPAPTSI